MQDDVVGYSEFGQTAHKKMWEQADAWEKGPKPDVDELMRVVKKVAIIAEENEIAGDPGKSRMAYSLKLALLPVIHLTSNKRD